MTRTSLTTMVPTAMNKGMETFPTTRKLTEAELRDKRAKGPCFRCDEKYRVGHKCKNKDLQVLLLQDEPIKIEEDESEINQSDRRIGNHRVIPNSLHSVVGLTSPRPMKIGGLVKGEEVIVLIACNASHNFIPKGWSHDSNPEWTKPQYLGRRLVQDWR